MYSLIFGMAHIHGQIDEYEVLRSEDRAELVSIGHMAMQGRDAIGRHSPYATCEMPDDETTLLLRFEHLRYVYVTPNFTKVAEPEQPQKRTVPEGMREPTFGGGPPGTERLTFGGPRA